VSASALYAAKNSLGSESLSKAILYVWKSLNTNSQVFCTTLLVHIFGTFVHLFITCDLIVAIFKYNHVGSRAVIILGVGII
jgi:hypothetical protein